MRNVQIYEEATGRARIKRDADSPIIGRARGRFVVLPALASGANQWWWLLALAMGLLGMVLLTALCCMLALLWPAILINANWSAEKDCEGDLESRSRVAAKFGKSENSSIVYGRNP